MTAIQGLLKSLSALFHHFANSVLPLLLLVLVLLCTNSDSSLTALGEGNIY